MKRVSLTAAVMAGLIGFAGMLSVANAVEPGFYGPLDGSGQGISLRCNGEDECVGNWLTYKSGTLEEIAPDVAALIQEARDNTMSKAVDSLLLQAQETPVSVQIWLQSQSNCPAAGEVCTLEMSEANGRWFGSEFFFDEPTVSVDLEQIGDTLIVDYNAIALLPRACLGVGPGGLLLRNCIGVVEFTRLAR